MLDIEKKITVDDENYTLVFNFNVMEEIQNEYGSVSDWGEKTQSGKDGFNIKAFIFGFGAMINEGIEIENEKSETRKNLMSQKQLGRVFSKIGKDELTEIVQSLIIESTKTDEKNA